MSKQDSLQRQLPYGSEPNLKELAIEATEEIIKAVYRRRKKKMPQGKELRALAIEHLESSIRNGNDDHLGTAKPLM